MTQPKRLNDVLKSELFGIACFLPVLLAVMIWDARWPTVWYSSDPTTFAWLDFIALIAVADFLFGKGGLMAVRTWTWTRLGISLIAVNLAFGAAYEMALVYRLFPPVFFQQNVRLAVLLFILVFVAWSKVEMILTWGLEHRQAAVPIRLTEEPE